MNEPAPSDLEIRRKRLRYRAWHRGMKESDLILGRFADRHLDDFSTVELGQFEAILEQSDPDIVGWIVKGQPVPAALDTPVMEMIKNFRIAL